MSESESSIDLDMFRDTKRVSGQRDSTDIFLERNVVGRIPKQLRHFTAFDCILQDIRDMRVLSNYQLYYLRSSRLSRVKLLEIIELYNLVIQNVNEIL